MHAILSVLIMISSLSINAWEVGDQYGDEAKYNLLLRDGRVSDLEKVLAKDTRILSGINLGRVIRLRSDVLQAEIQTYLKIHYPKKLSAAYSSAGNVHNPKIRPLRKPFEEAFINSSYVQSLATILRNHGYEITGISTEKFMLIEGKYFDAMTWLEIKKLTNQGNNSTSGWAR